MIDVSFGVRHSTVLKVSLLLAVAVTLIGCHSVKPTTSRGGKNLFETFYVGEEGTQYFIKPLTMSNKESKEEVLIDFTFRYKDRIQDSATVNFTILSSDIYKALDRLAISNTSDKTTTDQVKLLFNEKTKKGFKSRFSTRLPLVDVKKIFDHSDWNFVVSTPDQTVTFVPNKKNQKKINSLRDGVFVIM